MRALAVLAAAAALAGCPRAPLVVDAPGPSTPIGPAMYWYYQGAA